MAKKLGRKIPKVEEITLYYALLYDLRPQDSADLRNAMREFGEDIGQVSHEAVRAKAQVLVREAATFPGVRRGWFMEAVHSIRESRWQEELTRRRAKIAKAAALEAAQARNRAKKKAPAMDKLQ